MRLINNKFPGVYEMGFGKNRKIYTVNANPGVSVYEEPLITFNGIEYREWNHKKSKLGAAIMKDVSQVGMKDNSVVLYLGCASGTTVSHVSDMLKNGFIFALDFAPRVVRDMVFLAKERKNIAPMLEDASKPQNYTNKISAVDVVFQDIAQKDQVKIFLKNCNAFLVPGGFGILSLKARSIDVTKKPKDVFRNVKMELEKHIIIVDYRELDPYEKDHAIFVCKKK